MYVIRHEELGKQKSPWMNKKEMILLWLAGVGGAFGTAFEKPQCMLPGKDIKVLKTES